MSRCGKCRMPIAPDAPHACIVERVESLKARLAAVRSGLAEQWLRESGGGTYGPRTTGQSLDGRRTRPIRQEYFDRIVSGGRCLCCDGALAFKRNPTGGTYYACLRLGHAGYYIGFNPDTGIGYELVVSVTREVRACSGS